MSTMTMLEKLKARAAHRVALENGKLYLPVEIVREIAVTPLMEQMWNALWNAYLNNKGSISTTYWYDKFNDPKTFNIFIKRLSDLGWVNSIVVPSRHWAELSLVERKLTSVIDDEQLLNIRKERKFNKYKMESKTSTGPANLVKQNGHIKQTGLNRPGFAKAGTHTFKYDTAMIHKYYDAIAMNITKSMRKVIDKHDDILLDGADYQSISKELLDFYMYSPDQDFTLGTNYSDSRGRAISSALKKVFNPIGFKDARALIIQPGVEVPTDRAGIRKLTQSVYLFIAELMGVKNAKSQAKKAQAGKAYYNARTTHNLDLYSEDDRKDLHENIWLERLYAELDRFFSRDTSAPFFWTVPVELDAGASMLQIIGSLLNHKPYLEATNVIGSTITDPWSIEGISRPQVKFAATPMLYGSSQSVDTLWKKNGLSYTAEQVGIMSYELRQGFYSVANDFKNLIIENVQPKPEMTINVAGEKFDIECNRFRNVGEYTRTYRIYSTDSKIVERIAHTHTKRVPDLKQFKRWFQTGLVRWTS